MADIIRVELTSLETTAFGDYDSPGWALKEADRKGQVRALKNVLSLCDHRKEANG